MTGLLARAEFDRLIDAGTVPAGAFIMSTDAAVTALYADVGFHWVLIDREHGVMDNSDMRAHLMAAQANGAVAVVRVLENNPTLIQQSLDAGAQGIMVPKVETGAMAERAVLASQYRKGGRGMCPVVPATNFTGEGWSAHSRTTNENVLLIPLIETMRGVENVAEICAVDGVDYLFFGLADLSQDLGIDMERDIDQLIVLWEKVATTAHEHGVRVGAPLGYGFDTLADFGSLDSDLSTLRTAAQKSLAGFRASSSG